MCQRFQQARIQLALQDDCIEFTTGSGVLPGDTIAGLLFAQVYNDKLRNVTLQEVAEHESTNYRTGLTAVIDPVSNLAIDVSLTVFADDLARTECVCDSIDAFMMQDDMDQRLARQLEPAGLFQHPAKKKSIARFYGRKAHLFLSDIKKYRHPLSNQLTDNFVYLGASFTQDLKYNKEIAARITAAQVNWYRTKRLLTMSSLPCCERLNIFQTIIQTTLISALETCVLTDHQWNQLESWRMRHVYRICSRQCFQFFDHDGTILPHPISLSYNQARRQFNLPTLKSIVQLKRLNWIRNMGKFPQHYAALRATLFGQIGNIPSICTRETFDTFACPWLKLIKSDYDNIRQIYPILPNLFSTPFSIITLFTSDSPLISNSINLRRILNYFMENPHLADGPRTEVCNICGVFFADKRAVICHQRRVHNYRREEGIVALTNQCPYCSKIFATLATTKQHIYRRRNGTCPVSFSTAVRDYTLVQPDNIACPRCNTHFDNLTDYNIHVTTTCQ